MVPRRGRLSATCSRGRLAAGYRRAALMAGDGFAPTLLLAMPQLVDPNFTRSVVLLCKHSDEGALGFIVNRPVNTTASELLSLDPAPAAGCTLTVWEGGPVSTERGWLLCRKAREDGDGFAVT